MWRGKRAVGAETVLNQHWLCDRIILGAHASGKVVLWTISLTEVCALHAFSSQYMQAAMSFFLSFHRLMLNHRTLSLKCPIVC